MLRRHDGFGGPHDNPRKLGRELPRWGERGAVLVCLFLFFSPRKHQKMLLSRATRRLMVNIRGTCARLLPICAVLGSGRKVNGFPRGSARSTPRRTPEPTPPIPRGVPAAERPADARRDAIRSDYKYIWSRALSLSAKD